MKDKILEPSGVRLVRPSMEYLSSYVSALERGWSPDNMRGAEAAREQLEAIAANPEKFLSGLVARRPNGEVITLPDGSQAPRLPGFHRWLSDGEFCGSIGFRWQVGTSVLPPYVLGHIGYAVVPWKQGRGYATEALRELLQEVRAEELEYVEITTDPDNIASRRVVERNGGVLVEQFIRPAAYGSVPALRYRITLRESDI
jgi:predicted acetyltransferase